MSVISLCLFGQSRNLIKDERFLNALVSVNYDMLFV